MKPSARLGAQLAFLGTLPESKVDVAEAALLLASVDRPGIPLEPYRRHLRRLASDVAAYVGGDHGKSDVGTRAEALGQVIAKRFGYGGDEIVGDDPEESNMMRVIDHRRGTPTALGIVYMHCAGALGWPTAGVDFPVRLLVRLEYRGQRLILDPLAGGRVVKTEDMRGLLKEMLGNHAELVRAHHRRLGGRAILLRLQNRLKVHRLRQGHLQEALEAVETMLLFAPDAAHLWRESGFLNTRLDNVAAAVASFEEYLRRDVGDKARYRTSVLLQELRGRLS